MSTFIERLASARGRLRDAQKPGGGVPAYMRWVNRPAARLVVTFAYALGLSPNVVTALSLLWSALGIAILLVAPITLLVGIVVAFLFALAFVFDSADGQLARLTGRSGPAGEWLDHVADAFRTPAVHVAVAVAVWIKEDSAVAVAALVMAVVAAGQAMSQMLAEQLLRGAGRAQRRGGNRQSFILLPTDPGVWAWVFVLWGVPMAFAVAYVVLVILNLAHAAVSMLRRHRDLRRPTVGV